MAPVGSRSNRVRGILQISVSHQAREKRVSIALRCAGWLQARHGRIHELLSHGWLDHTRRASLQLHEFGWEHRRDCQSYKCRGAGLIDP
eukprot:2821280-Amphidinium_carterae.1